MDEAACPELLATLVKQYARFANLTVIDRSGEAVCSGVFIPKTVSLADRDYFKAGIAATHPVVGNPVIGRISRRPVLPIVYRLSDSFGTVSGIVSATLDLDWFAGVVAETQLRPGFAFAIWDNQGLVTARYPEPEKSAGKSMPDASIARALLSNGQASTHEVSGVDGIMRVYAFVPARARDTQLWSVVGIAQHELLAEVNRAFARNLAILALIALLAAGVAWILGDLVIRRHTRSLVAAAERLSEGDLKTRIGGRYGGGELGYLARSFDSMASALEAQHSEIVRTAEELKRANRGLQVFSAVNQALIHATEELALLQEVCRIGVDTGGYRLCSVIYAEHDEASLLRPMAWATHDDRYFDNLRATWERPERGGPVGTAIRTGETVIAPELAAGAGFESWRGQALARGSASLVVLPLRANGERLGALVIYGKADGFDQHEIKLLIDLANELVYGIEAVRIRDERNRALAELEDHQQHLEDLVSRRTAELTVAIKELESFSYSVSHDLRAPLRAIDGYSRMLEEDHGHKLDPEGRRLLKTVSHNAHSMGQLIHDLLAFSRLGRKPVAAAEIDMNTLVHEAWREVETCSEKKSPQAVLKTMPAAWGDQALIRQVWINLLSNAVKFSAGKEAPVIEVGGCSDTSENHYYVRDNGAGFDMQYYDRLFGVFQRLHRAEEYPGSGVGLAIVERVITKHGGRVWAEGKIDQGATFCFSLPHPQSEGVRGPESPPNISSLG
jgi:signal transduction histidine kinase